MCLLITICFCLACVVGASLFTLQTWPKAAKDPREWQIKCAAKTRGDWFIGLLRPEKERSPPPLMSKVIPTRHVTY